MPTPSPGAPACPVPAGLRSRTPKDAHGDPGLFPRAADRTYDHWVIVVVEVVTAAGARPPAGSPVRVEVRDAAREDAEAPLLGEAGSVVADGALTWLATVEVRAPDAPPGAVRRPIVVVHVDVDRDGAISAGDYLTTSSYPVPDGEGEVRVQTTVVPI